MEAMIRDWGNHQKWSIFFFLTADWAYPFLLLEKIGKTIALKNSTQFSFTGKKSAEASLIELPSLRKRSTLNKHNWETKATSSVPAS